jgi:hypothetical protein
VTTPVAVPARPRKTTSRTAPKAVAAAPVRTKSSHGALTRRLRATVALKLEKLEMDIQTSGRLSPADHERHSRALGTLAKAMEIVDDTDRVDTGNASDRRPASGKPVADLETASNDADELRRELAARIKRLRERLTR